jgi:amine acid ABC transporter, permease protein, 3-TM region, His/Glu/Gln/Arg/opine family
LTISFIEFCEFILTTLKILLPGLRYTFGLFLITIVCSVPLGLSMAFVCNSRNKFLRALVRGYVFVMRGSPLMLQLFFFYFGLPNIPFIGQFLVMDRFTAACVAFVVNYAAYFCEIFRGGLLSIDKGQYEAAQVLGMGKFQTTVRIVVPQMFKVALPSLSNETITLIKDTALATAIGVIDLMHLTKSHVTSTSNITPFAVAAVIYLLMTFGLTKVFNMLERKFKF